MWNSQYVNASFHNFCFSFFFFVYWWVNNFSDCALMRQQHNNHRQKRIHWKAWSRLIMTSWLNLSYFLYLQPLTRSYLYKIYIFVMFFCETWHLQHKQIICGNIGIIIVKLLPPIHPTSCPPLCGTNLEHRFRTKYHPDEASRLKAETQSALNNRLNVFTFLMENGWFDNVSLDIDQSPAIIKVLDAGEINSDGIMK